MAGYDNGYTMQIECPCGTVFEPTNIVTDEYGERWAICPECHTKIRLLAKD